MNPRKRYQVYGTLTKGVGGVELGVLTKQGALRVMQITFPARPNIWAAAKVYRTHQDFTRTGGIAVFVVKMIITDCIGQNPLRNCPHFKGSEGYLVCSQEPATCLYTAPN